MCRGAATFWNSICFDITFYKCRSKKANNVACLSTLCSLYLTVSQSEGDMVKLVNVSRFDGCCNDLGVDSDFPRPCIPRVVSDTWVAARLQDVTDAVISHKHHWHASWGKKKINTNFSFWHRLHLIFLLGFKLLYHFGLLLVSLSVLDLYDLLPWKQTVWLLCDEPRRWRVSLLRLRIKKKRSGITLSISKPRQTGELSPVIVTESYQAHCNYHCCSNTNQNKPNHNTL